MEELNNTDLDLIEKYSDFLEDGTEAPVEAPEETTEEPEQTIEEQEETSEDAPESDSEDDTDEEVIEVEEVDHDGLVLLGTGDEQKQLTVKELIDNYSDSESRKEEWDRINNFKNEALKQTQELYKSMELAKLESEYLLKEFDSVDWDSLSPEEFKAKYQNKQRLSGKREKLNQYLENHKKSIEESEAQTKALKATEARARLQREVAGFNDEVYTNALRHAVDVLGVDKDTAINLMDAGLIKLLIDAQRNYVDPAKTKAVSMPKKSVKTKAKVEKKTGFIDGNPDLPAWAESLF